MMTRTLTLLFGIGVAWMTTSCVSQKTDISSAYQQALECYYEALESGSSTLKCLGKLNRLIARNQQDMEAISLRSQIYWYKYQSDESPNPKDLKNFLQDLRFLAETQSYTPDAKDWVEPRVYTSFADLLILSGNQAQKGETALLSLEKSLVLYKAAGIFYTYALELAQNAASIDTATKGLQKEISNAHGGLEIALTKEFATLDRIQTRIQRNLPPYEALGDTSRVDLVADQKADLLEQVELLQAGQLNPTVQDLSVLSLNEQRQESLAQVYQLVLSDYKQTVPVANPVACQTELNPSAPISTICSKMLSAAEKRAIHAGVYTILAGDADFFNNTLVEALREYAAALAECNYCL